MRLLSVNTDGSFSVTSFAGNNIPSYAILSHTWETDYQEVTFQDICNVTGSSKKGYRKIQFCGKQAKKDGLQYFWVDSCCINKSSSSEQQEAINSMFRWYRDAAKCYVYLTDVSKHDLDLITWSAPLPYESAIRDSRWFTRGWTLQELLAPRTVDFFNKEGMLLGNRASLRLLIHEITGIALPALQGDPLHQFSVDERMSWAEKRQTTIEEDKVYSLLGIFDIYLPLIYGEGMTHAFLRLQEQINKRSSTKSVDKGILLYCICLPGELIRNKIKCRERRYNGAKRSSNARERCELRNMSNSKTGILTALKGRASGFYSTRIITSGDKAVLRDFFGCLRTPDVVNQF